MASTVCILAIPCLFFFNKDFKNEKILFSICNIIHHIIKAQNKELAVVINHLYDGEYLILIIHTLLVIYQLI